MCLLNLGSQYSDLLQRIKEVFKANIKTESVRKIIKDSSLSFFLSDELAYLYARIGKSEKKTLALYAEEPEDILNEEITLENNSSPLRDGNSCNFGTITQQQTSLCAENNSNIDIPVKRLKTETSFLLEKESALDTNLSFKSETIQEPPELVKENTKSGLELRVGVNLAKYLSKHRIHT